MGLIQKHLPEIARSLYSGDNGKHMIGDTLDRRTRWHPSS